MASDSENPSSIPPTIKRRRSATIESQTSVLPKSKRPQVVQESSDDDDPPPPPAKPYNLRASNKSNPGKVLGIYKRTREEWLAEQAQKRAQKEAAKGKSMAKGKSTAKGEPTETITSKASSSVLSQLRKKYQQEREELDLHDTFHPSQSSKGGMHAYLSPPPSQMDDTCT